MRFGGDRRDPTARRILYLQYTNPAAYPPLEHSSQLLAARGWHVLFLGISIPGEDELRFPPHPNITVRQLSGSESAWRQRVHYVIYALWVIGWTLRWRPSWIYVSDTITCPIVLLLLVVPGLAVTYHEHDSPPPMRRTAKDRLKLWARRAVARRAHVRVLPNQQRAAHFMSVVADRQPTFCVWNCPRRDEVGPPRAIRHEGKVRILYHGSIVPSRLPVHLLDALPGLPVDMLVVGYETQGHLGYTLELRQHAERLGIGHRVRIFPGMPRFELLALAREADVGLALVPVVTDDINMRWMTGASNKPFDYMAGGLAVLVSELPEWREMYVDPGYGLACQPEDPHSVRMALRWLVDHPAEMRAMGERGRQRIASDWNYETQFASVLNQIDPRIRTGQREASTIR